MAAKKKAEEEAKKKKEEEEKEKKKDIKCKKGYEKNAKGDCEGKNILQGILVLSLSSTKIIRQNKKIVVYGNTFNVGYKNI